MEYQLQPQQISQWKNEFKYDAETVFGNPSKGSKTEKKEREEELLRIIGQMKVENEYLKKNELKSLLEKRLMIEYPYVDLRISRQCDLLGLARSSFYYEPKEESVLSLTQIKKSSIFVGILISFILPITSGSTLKSFHIRF